jgi:hypothetical protein
MTGGRIATPFRASIITNVRPAGSWGGHVDNMVAWCALRIWTGGRRLIAESLTTKGYADSLRIPRFSSRALSLRQFEADFVAVDPDKATATKSNAGRRQKEKQLLEFQAFDRSFDYKPRSRVRDVQRVRLRRHVRSAHDVNGATVGESNPI